MSSSLFATTRRNALLSDDRLKQLFHSLLPYTKLLISLLIFCTILILIAYGFVKIGQMTMTLADFSDKTVSVDFLRNIALIVVIVKAYRVLVFYLRTLHVSIQYVVEMSIVAPAIEVIFAPHSQSLVLTAIFSAFSLLNLLMYFMFYDKMRQIDMQLQASGGI